MIEFSRFEWPFMIYKYRNSLSDGSDGRRDGVGEIQLEMNRSSARRYNGFLQYVRSDERLKIEGAKLVSRSEINNLRKLDGRQLVFEKYWKLFFHRAMKPANSPVFTASEPVAAPIAPSVAAAPERPEVHTYDEVKPAPVRTRRKLVEPDAEPIPQRTFGGQAAGRPVDSTGRPIERRKSARAYAEEAETIVPRRRSSDWGRDTEPRLIIRKSSDSVSDKTGTKD